MTLAEMIVANLSENPKYIGRKVCIGYGGGETYLESQMQRIQQITKSTRQHTNNPITQQSNKPTI
jgi:hypothetical protein